MLGTAQFGLHYGVTNQNGQIKQEAGKVVLQMAKNSGIDMLDTAIAYGDSEQILGKLGVNYFKVVTKLPALPVGICNIEEWINKQIEASLDRLGLNSIHGVLLHRSENVLGNAGSQVIQSLQRLKSQGLTQKIGVSIYDPQELVQVFKVMEIDLVQSPLNLLDRRLETSGWLTRLRARGVETHTRSSFLQGLLLMPRAEIPKKFERWSNIWDAWHNGLIECKTSATAACLSYPLSLLDVDQVVIGVDNAEQLSQLIKISNKKTRLDDWSFMISEDEQLINPTHWSSL
jgi:aryl-alcohol dehydrogenase-like predicted oxidoreductase